MIKLLMSFKHEAILLCKKIIFSSKGEPYRVKDQLLRFLPGTRPVKLDYINSQNKNARYDALQIKFFVENLNLGDFAVDIGGHAGQYALIMSAICGPNGHVITFEPDPYARKKLTENISLNPRVTAPVVEAMAVSDTTGEVILYSRGGNSQSSLARSGVEFSSSHQAESIIVPSVSIDTYLAKNGLPTPKIVKIDAEGAEIHILRGARKLLEGNTEFVVELHPYTWPEFNVTFDELKTLVQDSGRIMRYIDSDQELDQNPTYGTVLLEKNS